MKSLLVFVTISLFPYTYANVHAMDDVELDKLASFLAQPERMADVLSPEQNWRQKAAAAVEDAQVKLYANVGIAQHWHMEAVPLKWQSMHISRGLLTKIDAVGVIKLAILNEKSLGKELNDVEFAEVKPIIEKTGLKAVQSFKELEQQCKSYGADNVVIPLKMAPVQCGKNEKYKSNYHAMDYRIGLPDDGPWLIFGILHEAAHCKYRHSAEGVILDSMVKDRRVLQEVPSYIEWRKAREMQADIEAALLCDDTTLTQVIKIFEGVPADFDDRVHPLPIDSLKVLRLIQQARQRRTRMVESLEKNGFAQDVRNILQGAKSPLS